MISLFPPQKTIQQIIQLDSSKSISNRLLIINEVLGLNLERDKLSASDDTLILQKALEEIKLTNESTIDVKQAGTAFRFLTAYLASHPGTWTLTGTERMKNRPIAPLVDALRQMGAQIQYLEKEGYPPLLIQGQKLKGAVIKMDAGISSQFISSILLIAPLIENGFEIQLEGKPVSQPYIGMTIGLMEEFGFHFGYTKHFIKVKPSTPALKRNSHFIIESDWSSASYWYSVCALAKNCTIELRHLKEKSWQADSALPQIFDGLGVKSNFYGQRLIIENKAKTVEHFEFDFSDCPDLAQTVACCCFGLGISAQLTGLKTLQIKESLRIDTLVEELKKLGALVEGSSESLNIQAHRNPILTIPSINTHNDHRLAMSFAPLSINFPGLKIVAPEVVTKSYPSFWNDLQSVGFSLNLQP